MNIEFVNNFEFSEFLLKLSPVSSEGIKHSLFIGAEIRGSLMFQTKKLFCANETYFNNCNECILRYKCPYYQIFETHLPKESKIMRKYKEIPHPFVLAALDVKKDIYVRIVLFGKYIDFFPYFYFVLSKTGKKKGFKITEIKNFNRQILKDDALDIKFEKVNASHFNNEKSPSQYSINFITPLRIKYNNKLVNPTMLEFHHIIRNLLRRFSLLFYFYGGKEWKIDYKSIIEEAEKIKLKEVDVKWLELERYSARTKHFSPMGGIVGHVLLPEEAKTFLPAIQLGQYTQIGKNTSFGHGLYRVEVH